MTPAEFHTARLRLNRTQTELARMLGVTPLSIYRYESGLRAISPTIAILIRLLVKLYADDDLPIEVRRRAVHSRAA